MAKKLTYEELEQRVKELEKETVERKAAQQALQLSEQRLSLIYDSVIDVLFYIKVEPDDCFRFLSINQAFLKGTGLTRDQIVGKRIEEVIPETSVRLVLDNYKKAIEENRIVRWEETSVYPAGEKIGEVSIAPVLNEKKICTHLIGSVHDVTVRTQAEEALRKAHDELEQRVDERTQELGEANASLQNEIIEHKQAEEALRESEKREQVLLNAAIDPAMLIDSQGIVLALNKTAAHILNKSVDELIDATIFDFFPPDVANSRKLRCNEVFLSGGPIRFEDKSEGMLFDNSIYPVFDMQGKVVQLAIYGRDITKQRKAEEALRESEERYRTVVENSFEAIRVFNETGHLYANPACLELLGYEWEELKDLDGWAVVAPERREWTRERGLGRLRGEKIPGRVELPMLRKDGKRLFTEVMVSRVYMDGQPAILSCMRDTTERKRAQEALRESENKYRTLLENLPQRIFFKDKNSVYISCNGNYARDRNIKPDEITGKTLYDFFPKELAEKYRADDKRIMESGNTEDLEEEYIQDGQKLFVHTVKTPVKDENGNVVGVLGILWDITETKKLQAQLQETKKMEAIATLAGGIAHEFNNTLVGITGHIDLLQMDLPDNENVSKYTERMKVSALHMAHLTDQLLAYARGGKYQPKNISLSGFVEETLPLIKQTIAPSIRLETDLLHDILNVEADLTQMQMVLSAILNNSAEAIEEKGRIRITTRDEEIEEEFAKNYPGLKPGSYVSITVEDDGKGMDKETRSRIFDPFFTTKFHGRGLGMAAVYGIVTNHDGWISIDSQLGKGTVVRIYLPAVKVEVKEEKMPKIEPAKGTGTILVIEDEDIVIDVICAMLERLGYRVLLAETGKKAVNIAKSFDADIDLAILDILLPDLAGKEVYRDIMEARPNLKVIVCSGYAIDGPPQEILDAGAQDFIQKPFSYETLSEKLKEVLEGK